MLFLRRIIAPAGGQGGVTLSYLCQNCNSFPLEDNRWWVSAGKEALQLVVPNLWRKNLNGERPTGHWWQTGASASQANVSNARAVPQGLCENLINAFKLLANQQKDGDSPIQSMCSGRGPSEGRYTVC